MIRAHAHRHALALAIGLGWPALAGFDVLRRKNAEVERGNQSLAAGKAEDALRAYEEAVKRMPQEAGVRVARGAALSALSRHKEAGEEALRATLLTRDAKVRGDAFFNLGNALFRQDRFDEAAEAYKQALILDPLRTDAKWNLELARKRKQDEEEKKKPDQENQQRDQGKEKDKKKDKDDQNNQNDQKKDQPPEPPKGQAKDQEQDQAKQPDPQPAPGAAPPPPARDATDADLGAILDSLEKSPKDLEKLRAQMRAVRRKAPDKDW